MKPLSSAEATPQAADQEFYEMLRLAREEFKQNPSFQSRLWAWVRDLDDEGFFVFCYLVNDFNQQVLAFKDFEQTVYTLVMLRHKFLPVSLQEKRGLSIQQVMQILFALYEKLKNQEMAWDDCQRFVETQLNPSSQNTIN